LIESLELLEEFYLLLNMADRLLQTLLHGEGGWVVVALGILTGKGV
jgi:hypothetical protein